MRYKVPMKQIGLPYEEVRYMGVRKETYYNLLEMYPNTREALQELCLLKREIMLHYMEVNVNLKFKVPKFQRHATFRRHSSARSSLAQAPESLPQVISPNTHNSGSGSNEGDEDYGGADQGGTGG